MSASSAVKAVFLGGRVRVFYLLAVAVAAFALDVRVAAALGALQFALWWPAGLGAAPLARLLRKLGVFAALVVGVSALLGWLGPGHDWLAGVRDAALMVGRMVVVVMASQIARSGDADAFVAGLRRLRLPERIALALDTTLFLLGDTAGGDGAGRGGGTGRGGGRGRGGGGGGGRGDEARSPYRALGDLLRGDVAPLVDGVRDSLDRAEAHVRANAQGRDAAFVRDVAVIAGVSLAMLSLKMLKVLPGLPFAPGHKGVLLIPLYILAGALTRGRWGATATGLVMGTVAFLLGDGKYGVFEILKHLTPGVIVDLGLPLVYRGRERRALVWAIFGVVIATGRFATIVVVLLLVRAPRETFALIAPFGAVHLVFGALSGFVTYHLMKTGRIVAATAAAPAPRESEPPVTVSPVEVTRGRDP